MKLDAYGPFHESNKHAGQQSTTHAFFLSDISQFKSAPGSRGAIEVLFPGVRGVLGVVRCLSLPLNRRHHRIPQVFRGCELRSGFEGSQNRQLREPGWVDPTRGLSSSV